jgi:hypothetical protein
MATALLRSAFHSATADTTLNQARRMHPLLLTVSLAIAAGIFLFDLFIPQGLGVPVLYMSSVVLVAFWTSPKESGLVILVGALCSVLTVAGFFLAPASELPFWVSIPNRLMALFVIWVTVVLSLLRKANEDEVKMLRGLLPICSYCKKIRDDRGYWESLEVYIASHTEADFTHGLCPECGVEHYPEVFRTKDSARQTR